MSDWCVVSGDTIIQKNLSYAQAMILWDKLDLMGFENVEVKSNYCYENKPI